MSSLQEYVGKIKDITSGQLQRTESRCQKKTRMTDVLAQCVESARNPGGGGSPYSAVRGDEHLFCATQTTNTKKCTGWDFCSRYMERVPFQKEKKKQGKGL